MDVSSTSNCSLHVHKKLQAQHQSPKLHYMEQAISSVEAVYFGFYETRGHFHMHSPHTHTHTHTQSICCASKRPLRRREHSFMNLSPCVVTLEVLKENDIISEDVPKYCYDWLMERALEETTHHAPPSLVVSFRVQCIKLNQTWRCWIKLLGIRYLSWYLDKLRMPYTYSQSTLLISYAKPKKYDIRIHSSW